MYDSDKIDELEKEASDIDDAMYHLKELLSAMKECPYLPITLNEEQMQDDILELEMRLNQIHSEIAQAEYDEDLEFVYSHSAYHV